mmetsp:Transcript_40575/g.108851  ORF Transcript_40575/g.108851 Transcript_40575/m.108851 type:complete len:86 (-) Transcript_40575:77-334(-)
MPGDICAYIINQLHWLRWLALGSLPASSHGSGPRDATSSFPCLSLSVAVWWAGFRMRIWLLGYRVVLRVSLPSHPLLLSVDRSDG